MGCVSWGCVMGVCHGGLGLLWGMSGEGEEVDRAEHWVGLVEEGRRQTGKGRRWGK